MESCTDFALADPCYIKEAQACPEHPLPIAKLCRYRCKSLGRALVLGSFVKWPAWHNIEKQKYLSLYTKMGQTWDDWSQKSL